MNKKSDTSNGMDYLLSPVRREMEERIRSGSAEYDQVLLVDFKTGDLAVNGRSMTRFDAWVDGCHEVHGRFPRFPDGQFDCVVVNLQLSWLDFGQALPEIRRILHPGGDFYFSTFGPDTLREIHQAWSRVDALPHVHPFTDMHHLGDMLISSGFLKPIVDADWWYIDFPDVDLLFHDLKHEGFTNQLSGRRKTLTGKNRFDGFRQALMQCAAGDSGYRVTFEIIYGYAKNPDATDGSVRVTPPGRVAG